jgi:serine/threonine-protein kinase
MPPERVVWILKQVCLSLAEAHAVGLIHRDIKPGNIFVCRKGMSYDFAKVLDFGLVRLVSPDTGQATKLTLEGQITGTPAYMAPEMASGGRVDHRADIYSLGCVAYWALTGALVFEEESPLQMVLEHLQTIPVPTARRTEFSIPPDLDALILRCLEKSPDKRPTSMMDLFNELKTIQGLSPWTAELARDWWKQHLPEKSSRKAGWHPDSAEGSWRRRDPEIP